MQSLFSQSLESRQSAVNNEWDQMRLLQRSNAIMSRAAFLTTDGAKAQFSAFAKIKANVEEARHKLDMPRGSRRL